MFPKTTFEEYLTYVPESNVFLWKKKTSVKSKVVIGSQAGTYVNGYVAIGLLRKRFYAHRLVWLFETNTVPTANLEIDHINRNRSDNRFCNLRLVTVAQNQWNATPPLNKEYVVGVVKVGTKYRTGIKSNGKYYSLGTYPTLDEARTERKKAEYARLSTGGFTGE